MQCLPSSSSRSKRKHHHEQVHRRRLRQLTLRLHVRASTFRMRRSVGVSRGRPHRSLGVQARPFARQSRQAKCRPRIAPACAQAAQNGRCLHRSPYKENRDRAQRPLRGRPRHRPSNAAQPTLWTSSATMTSELGACCSRRSRHDEAKPPRAREAKKLRVWGVRRAVCGPPQPPPPLLPLPQPLHPPPPQPPPLLPRHCESTPTSLPAASNTPYLCSLAFRARRMADDGFPVSGTPRWADSTSRLRTPRPTLPY